MFGAGIEDVNCVPQPAVPVVLIGPDGADWNIIQPLFEMGKLPYLQALVREGSWGVLQTDRPAKSLVIWTSIASGMTMKKHGILDYRYVTENNIEIPYSAGERRAKTFWNILREEGMKDYWSEGEAKNIPVPEGRERQVKNFRIYVLQDKSIENVSLFLMENISVDLFATYLRLIDTISHFTSIFINEVLREQWIQDNEKFGVPTPETEEKLYRNMDTVVEPVYSYLDQVVGRIMAKFVENTTFMLVSDHGFKFSSHGYGHYETPKLAHGIILIKGPGIKPGTG